MEFYYYGYDATNYGPARKSEIHKSKDLKNARKNAYKMVKSGWESVCIVDFVKKKEITLRVVSFDERIGKIVVINTLRKTRPTYILKSDGEVGKRIW